MINPNPFTPQSGWEPKIFGGRQEQIQNFTKTLTEAVKSRCNHMVIIGQWGIGKTSLLKQFKKIIQEQGYLASYCPLSLTQEHSSATNVCNLIMQEILMGFPKIKDTDELLFSIENPRSKTTTNDKDSRKKIKLQPQVKFTQFLLGLWKHLNTKLAVVLLDDIQNLLNVSSVIDLLRAVLSKDDIINQTKFLFILSSTPEGWASFINKHDPVGRFFRRREIIGNLDTSETKQIIIQTLQGTGVSFEDTIIDNIYFYTKGHPYELQLLCSNLYEAQIEGEVKLQQWEQSFRNTLGELGKEYFDSLYQRASDREKEVLQILVEKKKDLPIGEIRKIMIVEKRAKNFPVANVKNFLYRLENKGIIIRLSNDHFQILDPMLGEYILLFKREH